MPPIRSPLIPIRRGVWLESFLPDVSETVSWVASSSEHFVNIPAASSRPVVALICGGAILEIINFGLVFTRCAAQQRLNHLRLMPLVVSAGSGLEQTIREKLKWEEKNLAYTSGPFFWCIGHAEEIILRRRAHGG